MSNPRLSIIRSLLGVVVIIGAAAFVLPGCSSSTPQVSGFAIGNTRFVKVGELVTLRMPLSESGTRRWRVSKYSSTYLAIVEAPRAVATSSGGHEIVTRARAKVAGTTEIEMIEIAPEAGQSPRTVTFKLSIRN